MANDFIKINQADSSAKFAADLKTATVQTKNLLELYAALIARGQHMFDGSDFTDFEEMHGLPVGTGQTVYDMLNGALIAMNGTGQNAQAVALKNRVG